MSQDNLNAIFSNASAVVFILNSEGNIIFYNTVAAKLLQYDLSEIEGQPFLSLLDRGAYQDIQAFIAFKGAYHEQPSLRREINIVKKSGISLPVIVHMTRMTHKGQDIFMIILEEREGYEKEKEEFILTHKQMADQADELISLYDSSLNCLYVNPACQEILGYSPAEYKSAGGFLSFIDPAEKEKMIALFRKDSENRMAAAIYTYHSRHKEGGLVQLENHVGRIFNQQEQLRYLAASEKKVSKHKKNADMLPFEEETLFLLVNKHLKIEYASANSGHIIGYSSQELMESQTVYHLIHPKDLQTVDKEKAAGPGKGVVSRYSSFQIRHKQAGYVLMKGAWDRFYDEAGNLAYGILRLAGDTGMAGGSRLPVEQSRYLQLMAENMDEIICFYNRDLTLNYISPAIERALGYCPEELISEDISSIIHFRDIEKVRHAFSRAGKRTAEKISCRIRDKGGAFHPFTITFKTMDMQENNLLSVFTLLKSEEVDKEALPAYRKQFLDDVFYHLPDAVLVLDRQNHQLMDCNAQAVRMLEASNKEEFVRYFDLASLLSMDDEVSLHFLQQYEAAPAAVRDIQWVTLKGRLFWGRTSLIDLDYDDSHIRVMQITDMTEQKNSAEALQSAKEAAEKTIKSREDFFSTMSHEIRTPLNAVLGMTYLMLQKEPREDQKKLLQTLKFAGESLTALINDILDYSKIEAGKLELHQKDFNLKEFIHGVKLTYKNLANDKGLIFRLLMEEELPVFVRGDVNRLGQILNNLLNNAIKFTAKGQIVMSVYMEEDQGEQYILLFEVADTGIGIPQDKQEAVFDPYQQASPGTAEKFGGTGLGLSIVKNLVNLQHGMLSLESKEGTGTTFKVKLPFGKPENPEYSHENDHDNFISEYSSLEGLKVLYVEDVIPNQLLMEGLCDNWKINLDTALNGLEALEKVKKSQYDLILMDIQMPEKNGYETALEIRSLKDAHYENIPIIALSASISEKIQRRIRESGMDDYVSKPIDPKYLHEKLARFLKSSSSVSNLAGKGIDISHEEVAHATDTPDFTQLQVIYTNDIPGYIRILEQVRQLTLESVELLIDSIRNADEKTFRFTSHKLMSYIRLLKLQRLEGLIEEAKGYAVGGAEAASREYIATELEYHFRHFLNKINEEIAKHN